MAIFCVAFLDGMIVALVYWTIRVFRRMIRHNLLWISVEDGLFWILTGIYLFSEIYRVCQGMIRWYFVMSVCCGGILVCIIMQKLEKKYVDNSKKKR